MQRTVGVLELEYWIHLPGVPALKIDHCPLCLQGIGRLALVAAVEQSAGEDKARGQSQVAYWLLHVSQRISGSLKEDRDERPFWV